MNNVLIYLSMGGSAWIIYLLVVASSGEFRLSNIARYGLVGILALLAGPVSLIIALFYSINYLLDS